MTRGPLTACTSCAAQIRWVRIRSTGRRMPLDPDPVDNGNVQLLDAFYPDGAQAARVVSAKAAADAQPSLFDLDAGEPDALEGRYVSHFATCPYAPRHRRRGDG